MASYNKVILIGRMVAEPELRYTPNGTPVANFAIAVDRNKGTKEEKETDFINIVTWQKLAEICAQYLTKGKLIMIDGRLQVRSYEANDGTKKRVYEVVASNMQMLDKSGKTGENMPDSYNSERELVGQAANSRAADPLDEINTDDIPF